MLLGAGASGRGARGCFSKMAGIRRLSHACNVVRLPWKNMQAFPPPFLYPLVPIARYVPSFISAAVEFSFPSFLIPFSVAVGFAGSLLPAVLPLASLSDNFMPFRCILRY